MLWTIVGIQMLCHVIVFLISNSMMSKINATPYPENLSYSGIHEEGARRMKRIDDVGFYGITAQIILGVTGITLCQFAK